MKNETDILETLIYLHGKNVYFDKLIVASSRGCAIILIYFARKNDTEKNGRFEGTGFSHLVVNGRYVYICEHY